MSHSHGLVPAWLLAGPYTYAVVEDLGLRLYVSSMAFAAWFHNLVSGPSGIYTSNISHHIPDYEQKLCSQAPNPSEKAPKRQPDLKSGRKAPAAAYHSQIKKRNTKKKGLDYP